MPSICKQLNMLLVSLLYKGVIQSLLLLCSKRMHCIKLRVLIERRRALIGTLPQKISVASQGVCCRQTRINWQVKHIPLFIHVKLISSRINNSSSFLTNLPLHTEPTIGKILAHIVFDCFRPYSMVPFLHKTSYPGLTAIR